MTAEGLKVLGPIVATLADCEGLDAHANAVRIRLRTLAEGGYNPVVAVGYLYSPAAAEVAAIATEAVEQLIERRLRTPGLLGH